MRKYLLFIVLSSYIVPSVACADPIPLRTLMSLGVGVGNSSISGDFIKNTSGAIFNTGINAEGRNWLFEFIGGTDTGNRFSTLKFLVGFGCNRFKIGTGFIGDQAEIPTENSSSHLAQQYGITLDPSRNTKVSVTSVPLYLRLDIVKSRTFLVQVNAFYALYSNGSMTIPVLDLGQPAYISTVPKKQGGKKGFDVHIGWRLPQLKNVGLALSFRYEKSTMDHQSSKFENDYYSVLGTATTPDIMFISRSVLLSVIYLY